MQKQIEKDILIFSNATGYGTDFSVDHGSVYASFKTYLSLVIIIILHTNLNVVLRLFRAVLGAPISLHIFHS